jgi:Flp pilus assembly protein TadD
LAAWDASAAARRRCLYVASIFVFLLALLSKPGAFTAPAVMFVIDAWLLRRPWRQVVLRLLPWFAMSIAIAGIARWNQPPITGVSDLGYEAYTTPAQRPLIVGHTLAFYLRQVVWPAKLCMDYGHLPTLVLQWPWTKWAWIVPVALLAVAAACWRTSRVPLGALAIFILAIFPMLGWVPFDTQFFSTTADHYLYVAMLGVSLFVGWIFTWIPARAGSVVVAVALAAVLGVRSFLQAGTWRDTRAVFEHVLTVNSRSWLAHCNLAQLAIDQQDWGTAVEHCHAAIDAQPRYVRSYTLLGTALAQQKDLQGARLAYAAVVEIRPDDPTGYSYLGGVEASLGDAAAAARHLQKALSINPAYAPALLNYGTLLMTQGDFAGGETYLRRAVQRSPAGVKARLALAACMVQLGHVDEAVTQLQIAYTLQPQNPAIVSMLHQLGAAPSTTMPAR